MESQKSIHKHWYGKANKTSSCECPSFCSRRNWHGEGDDDDDDDVFDEDTKEVIENCRVICDLKSLLVKIYKKESVMVGSEETNTFLNTVRSITGSVATIIDGDLMNHYRMFVAHLETIFVKSIQKFDPLILNSKEIIQSILKKENITLLSNFKFII